jgi:hypothetical protein
MEDLFPLRQGIDLTKLKITKEGEYSITRRRDAERIRNVMVSVLKTPETMIITDATGCVGGDTIHFGFLFQQVFSIEKNIDNFLALANNVQVYDLKNTFLYCGDSVEMYNWYTDVLYVDPPWGGKEYRNKKDLDLWMSEKRLDVWLEDILLRKNRPKYIFLKLPVNYNFKRFNFLSNIDLIKPFQIRTYILVMIKVHLSKNNN